MKSYDAPKFLEKPEWGPLFDTAFKESSRIFEDDWSPAGELGMPLEFVGSFAIGDTCKGHLITALAAQHAVRHDLRRYGIAAIHGAERATVSRLPTVTDERVLKWYKQRELIRYALAADNKTPMPGLEYCKEMWDKIDDAIITSLGPGGRTRTCTGAVATGRQSDAPRTADVQR